MKKNKKKSLQESKLPILDKKQQKLIKGGNDESIIIEDMNDFS